MHLPVMSPLYKSLFWNPNKQLKYLREVKFLKYLREVKFVLFSYFSNKLENDEQRNEDSTRRVIAHEVAALET